MLKLSTLRTTRSTLAGSKPSIGFSACKSHKFSQVSALGHLLKTKPLESVLFSIFFWCLFLSGEKVLKFDVCALFENCYHCVKAFKRCRLLCFVQKREKNIVLSDVSILLLLRRCLFFCLTIFSDKNSMLIGVCVCVCVCLCESP